MNLYEKKVSKELEKWQKNMLRKSYPLNRAAKNLQVKAYELIPTFVQDSLTKTIKAMTQTILFGSGNLTDTTDTSGMSLAERDLLVREKYELYKNTAVIQGAGFGAGGILLAIADFPALMSIKIKFLFDCAHLYGYNVQNENERLYMLHVFQLAFSADEHRTAIYEKLVKWDTTVTEFSEMDWEKFQIEYRDFIDLAKLLQLLPVVGAAVGAVANYTLMDRLYECTKNCYRMRYLQEGKL